jgi:hypothetical protein
MTPPVDAVQQAMLNATQASAHAARLQAFAAIGQAAVAIVLLFITAWYAWTTRQLLLAQINPSVDIAIDAEAGDLFVDNHGTQSISDLSVVANTDIVVGPPINRFIMRLVGAGAIPGRHNEWWFQAKVEKHATIRHSLRDLAEKAYHAIDSHIAERKRAKEAAYGGQIWAIASLTVTYHRAVDHREYGKTIRILFGRTQDGKYHYMDPGILDLMQRLSAPASQESASSTTERQ